MWDVFISHAWEDKEDIARPLAEALRRAGLRVWYDEFTLTLGDSLRRSIDRGLAQSRYGVVILSPHFFAKEWPQRELDGLVAKEVSSGKTILPVWHNVTWEDVSRFSPTLADRLAVSTAKGLDAVVEEILRALREEHQPRPHSVVKPTPAKPRRPVNWERVGAIAGKVESFIRSRPFIALIATILALVAIVTFALFVRFRPSQPITPEVPPARVVRTASEIHIDGFLDESVWSEVDSLIYAVHPVENGSTTATVRFLWDDDYLYAAFDINDTQVEMADLSTLWDSDSVSLLLHDGGIAEHRQSLGEELSDDMAVQLKPGTTLNEPANADTGYTVEMRIKWKEPPLVGRRIPADLLSVDHDANPGAKHDAPSTVFSKLSWNGDGDITSAGASLLLVDSK
jgi:hypothetical protein